jgi:hypothetical protein
MLKANTRQQIEYKLDISLGNGVTFKQVHLDVLAKAISKVVGGATFLPMKGVWCEGLSQANKNSYADLKTVYENGLQVQVKCEIAKEKRLEKAFKDSLAELNSVHGLEIDWVCGTKEVVNGFNFSMKAQ